MNWVTLAVLLLGPWLWALLALCLRSCQYRTYQRAVRRERHRALSERTACSHWPRMPVISGGATVAYICHKCDATVHNEHWILTGESR